MPKLIMTFSVCILPKIPCSLLRIYVYCRIYQDKILLQIPISVRAYESFTSIISADAQVYNKAEKLKHYIMKSLIKNRGKNMN